MWRKMELLWEKWGALPQKWEVVPQKWEGVPLFFLSHDWEKEGGTVTSETPLYLCAEIVFVEFVYALCAAAYRFFVEIMEQIVAQGQAQGGVIFMIA